MTDVTPALLEKIQKDFAEGLADSPVAKQLDALIKNGTATYRDALKYAEEVGEILKNAFGRHLSASVLPDGRMYYNIAKRLLEPTLTSQHHIVADMAAKVQEVLNKKAGLGLRGLKPDVNKDRINGFIARLSQEEDFDKVKWILDEPVKNFAQNVVDETVRKNAEFHAASGLSPTITRTVIGEHCKWCDELAGTYLYEEVKATGHPVFMRHDHCDCLVEYNPGDGRKQNAHTKRWSQ